MVTNPECWPRVAIILSAAVFYMVFITVCLMFHIVEKYFADSTHLDRNQELFQQHPSTEYVQLVEISNNSSRKWKTSTFVRLLAVSAVCRTVGGCQQLILVSSTVARCTSRDQSCTSFATAVAKFNTTQSQFCLQSISCRLQWKKSSCGVKKRRFILLNEPKHACNPVKDVRTCVLCRTQVCGHFHGHSSPGARYSQQLYGNNLLHRVMRGWGCSCGFPSSGCLFCRIYHVPVNGDVPKFSSAYHGMKQSNSR
ncbi:hypothetical protein COOONC_24289 [Cooperia oncophora]